ncbi:P-loop containing nucleoside triphosphate hydrolase protein [Phlegmacium glaucopus]|nr:P-loop containing nucleoside triphosphate hydrolase protein [Phlegmacium glaucopus]
MAQIFWLQFRALFWKNWIVLSKHSILNILRCVILPIAFGVFLATAQSFLIRQNNFGLGTPVSIFSLQSRFDGKTTLVWADGTDGTSNPTPKEIISHITTNFTPNQLTSVKQLSSPLDIPATCPQNFRSFSQCFAAVAFTSIPADGNASNPINYTIFGDGALAFIDVKHHTSDFEMRILPLQWAIDQAIIELQTGVQQQIPLEWPFTRETNQEQSTRIRLSFIRGIRQLLAIALYVTFIGIAYQLPGSVAGERATLITEYMRAMGLLDSARILSWYISISVTYLPAWIIVALTWKFRIFTESNTGLIVVVHLLLGLVLASWSFFVSAPFGKSPHLAAVASTFLGLVFAILALVLKSSQSGTLFIFSLLFPPSFYIFALKAICGYENHQLATNVLKGDPDRGIVLLPLIIAAVIDVFLWPYLAVLWERHLYGASVPSKRSWAFWKKRTMSEETPQLPEDVAISIRGLTKTYKTSMFTSKGDVTAVSDLSLDIPKTGIFVLLGSNGAGKSTALSVIGGLSSITSGTITFQGGLPRPPRGTLGLVPQKNVLFSELTCLQTLRVWKAVKWSKNSLADEDLEQLLRDCDLETKIHSNAATLSGGQKRKLQLAIGLLGGSQIMLVDECTSGVDPLSRRALWKILTSFRDDRCIVFTTHFLDEADLLADHIAILAAPGKVVASGPPVALKRDLGEGYSIQVTFTPPADSEKIDTPSRHELLLGIKTIAPHTYVTMPTPNQFCYHLKAKDTEVVRQVLGLLDNETNRHAIASYDILGTTIEDIFLDLMSKNDIPDDSEKLSEGAISPHLEDKAAVMDLPTGRPMSPFQQALTIFYKRTLILKRSWLTPVLTVIVAIAGATIPLVFISNETASCSVRFLNTTSMPLYLPSPPVPVVPPTIELPPPSVVASPPNIVAALGNSTNPLQITNVPDNATFVNYISQNFFNLSLGGVSFDVNTGASLIAWEASPPGFTGLSMLNLATNLLYNRALNVSGNAARTPILIQANYASFPPVDAGTLVSLRWVIIFGAAMAVHTAFYALYATKERRSSVQAMQFSNGLTDPIGLWLGHLMFDVIWSIVLSSIIIIIFAAVSNQFHGLGFLWVVFVLYGFAGALFSYCVSLIVPSPLAAFATAAGYQFLISVLYLASPLLVVTYGKVTASSSLITIIHFTTSIVAPVANVLRAALVSINMFSLLCEGNSIVNTTAMGSIKQFGGPILYLFVYSFVLLSILVWADSGSLAPRRLRPRKGISSRSESVSCSKEDVVAAANAVSNSDDLLRVLNVSKMYNSKRVVDDVSLGVPRDTLFALLGPNGAGKTTTFNIIRGDVVPDIGDVLIDGISVVRHPRTARSALGVCPQFTAIDSQLSVREHLIVYGRLKGLRKGQELDESVEAILEDTALNMYADRLASKLSGGNQRKLSLAIALIGNPSVLLIDEFSTGIDPKMKREMWQTLRRVARGKAVIITTHSMEEASALANSVGILAKQMLAVGSTESLSARYAAYEVHFTCRTREEVVKARALMALIPGSRMADDVATRFEVPIESENGLSLAQLFNALSSHDDFTEYTVEKATLESVFLKVIRENNVREEDNDRRHGYNRSWWKCIR